MPARSPEERALIARIANRTRLAQTTDYNSLTAKARSARRMQFEQQALDLDATLEGDALARAADHLMRAHMLRMTLKAKQARRRAKEQTQLADVADAALAELAG